MKQAKRLELVALLCLILLAAALRLYRLDAQDIWGDEAFSISLSQQPLSTVIAGAADTHPPLYPLLLFFWLRLVGSSAFATRALSALTGILAIPLIFVIAKRLIPSRPRVAHADFAGSAAWFAALLAAVSPLLIYYSQETRMYEPVAVLALASTYFAARVIEASHPERSHPERNAVKSKDAFLRAAYFVSTALALYTHYSAFFVLAAQNVFALARLRKDRAALTRWALLQLALVAAYIPWIIVQTSFLRGKASERFDEWGWRGIEMIFGKTFLAFSAGLTVDFPIAQIAAVIFLVLAALGMFALSRNRGRAFTPVSPESGIGRERPSANQIQIARLAPLCFIVPVVIAYAINPIMPFFFERYVLVALPGFIVTVALGLDFVARRSTRAAVGIAGILVIVSAFSLWNYYFNDAYAKGKYGQMMAYVASHAQPGDALILNNPLQKPLYNYYAPRGITAFYFPDGAPLEDPQTRQQFEIVAHSHPRLWLVMFGNPAEYDPTGYLERWLGANAFKSFSRGFVDAGLGLYDMPAAATIQRPLRATLGENIRLVGYDLDRAQIAPGETLQLTLHWQATAPIAARYKVFTHLIAEATSVGAMNPLTQSPVWAQMDSEPVGGSRPTTTWQAGETIDDRYGLQIPPNTPPGEYTLEVGMYDPATLARLPARDESGARVAEDRVVLGTVRISGQ
ncbi:MAG: glycosyltransferase family 39 protein [Chloroflexota bacterium]|nr:glycosyltransferase family 39 protein [Chloroflexota bacterium]